MTITRRRETGKQMTLLLAYVALKNVYGRTPPTHTHAHKHGGGGGGGGGKEGRNGGVCTEECVRREEGRRVEGGGGGRGNRETTPNDH